MWLDVSRPKLRQLEWLQERQQSQEEPLVLLLLLLLFALSVQKLLTRITHVTAEWTTTCLTQKAQISRI